MRLWTYIKSLNETFSVAVILVVIAIPAGIWFSKHQFVFICPEDYHDQNTADKDMDVFIEKYLTKNPSATIEDLTSYRYDLLLENNCKKTLDYIGNSKNDYQKSFTEDYNGEYAKNRKIYESELGFSFEYPDYMFVSINPEDPGRIMILPNSMKVNKDEALNGIIISTSENPSRTPLEYMNSQYSGADMSAGYEKWNLDGQEAIAVDGGTWVVVNTPDNRRRLSIALLMPSEAEYFLFTEMGIVVNSLTFTR